MTLKTVLLSGALWVVAALGMAQTPVITAFANNGMLTWADASTALYYRVEWAPSLAGSNAWFSNYWSLTDIRATNATVTVPVPVFYRVSAGDNRLLHATPVPKSGQTNSYQTGDDGFYRTGLPAPVDRFSAGTGDASNCVIDNLTGLMWLRNPDVISRDWSNAIEHCEGVDGGEGRGGFTDWRLPNFREVQSLLDFGQDHPALPAGHPFIGIPDQDYSLWSSTTFFDGDGAYVDMNNGGADRTGKSETWPCTWPVRGIATATPSSITAAASSGALSWTNASTSLYYCVEWAPSLAGSNAWFSNYWSLVDIQPTANAANVSVPVLYRVSASISRSMYPAPVPKTGQTNSVQEGDDGEYEIGAQHAGSRFKVGAGAASNCVADEATGLMWLRNPDDVNRSWSNAIAYCEGLDGTQGRGGYSDWRLPNIREMQSLIDFGQHSPSLPAGHPFVDERAHDYWTSTTFYDGGGAFVDLFNGGSDRTDKSEMWLYTWPVRGVATVTNPPSTIGDMVLIPAGDFMMGNATNVFPASEGYANELPQHAANIGAFYMDRYEVTKTLWDQVAVWAANNSYDIAATNGSGKAANHPVQSVSWYECVKWCNARAEREGLTVCYTVASGNTYRTGDNSNVVCNWSANGYRLPTEAEWEKAARGGVSSTRFPWSDSDESQHARANYQSRTNEQYDTSATRGYHPIYTTGGTPYTSPVGSFAGNNFGLYDMAGNVWEWCWDWYSPSYYEISPALNPRGAESGSHHTLRGGGWVNYANVTRVPFRQFNTPSNQVSNLGFRCARGL